MSLVADRAGADVLVVEQIGRTRSVTPEGYLLCEAVRIASTKPLAYRADEIPEIEPDAGMVIMHRPEEVLFCDETIASFQGKSLTNEHPANLLSPVDWRENTVGVVLNPRRGEGVEDSYLIADLLITDASAISDVQSGRREVSCGYDGEREQIKPGLGQFTRIIGNHVALVERGRCGPSCAIGDENTMAKRTVWDRLRTAFKAKDEAAFEEELANAETEMDEDEPQRVVIEVKGVEPVAREEGEKAVEAELGKTEDEPGEVDPIAFMKEAIAAIMARLDAIETGVAKNAAAEAEETAQEMSDEAGEGETAEEEKSEAEEKQEDGYAMDSAGLRGAFQDVVAKAEILAPGVKLPTFDSSKPRKTMADAMCGLRKAALERAYADDDRKAFIVKVAGAKPDFAKMSCDHMTVVFNAATELARAANNAPRVSMDNQNFRQGPMTAAKMQEMIAARRKPGANA